MSSKSHLIVLGGSLLTFEQLPHVHAQIRTLQNIEGELSASFWGSFSVQLSLPAIFFLNSKHCTLSKLSPQLRSQPEIVWFLLSVPWPGNFSMQYAELSLLAIFWGLCSFTAWCPMFHTLFLYLFWVGV
jgi:hypothetical protein